MSLKVLSASATSKELADLQQALKDLTELVEDDGTLELSISGGFDTIHIPSCATEIILESLRILAQGNIVLLDSSSPCYSIPDLATHLGTSVCHVQCMISAGVLDVSPDGRVTYASLMAKESIIQHGAEKFSEADCEIGSLSVSSAISMSADELILKIEELEDLKDESCFSERCFD
jgi:hypothetical protein